MEPVVVSCDGCGARPPRLPPRVVREIGRVRCAELRSPRLRHNPTGGTDRQPISEPGPECGLDAPERPQRPLRFGAADWCCCWRSRRRSCRSASVSEKAPTRDRRSARAFPSRCASPATIDRQRHLTPAPSQTCDPPRRLNLLEDDPRRSSIHPRNLTRPQLRADVTPAVPPPAAGRPRQGAEAHQGPDPERDETVVARVHGEVGGEVHIMLPDGQLGIPDRPAFTDEPFQPATADEIEQDLLDGAFAGFKVLRKPHYLIVYQSSEEFAEESGRVLEKPVQRTDRRLPQVRRAGARGRVPARRRDLPHRARLPGPQAGRPGDPGVLRDLLQPDLLLRDLRPRRTSPRSGRAPASPDRGARGDAPDPPEHRHPAPARRLAPLADRGPGRVLLDPAGHEEARADLGRASAWSTRSTSPRSATSTTPSPARSRAPLAPSTSAASQECRWSNTSSRKTDLTPTDYALAWAMTHYLAMKRVDEFIPFLKAMSNAPPLQPMTPEDHLAAFRGAFGDDLEKLDREIGTYLSKLKIDQSPALLRGDVSAARRRRPRQARGDRESVALDDPAVARHGDNPARRPPCLGSALLC